MSLARTLADPPIARLWGALALAATGVARRAAGR